MQDQPNPQAGSLVQDLAKQAYACASEHRFSEAKRLYQKALVYGPASAAILSNLGTCCFECGDYENAIAYYRAAIALNPKDHKTHTQLGIVLLLTGHDAQAWSHFDHRKFMVPSPVLQAPPLPAWNGGPLNGRGIAVLREQGLGDILHLVRYVSLIEARGGTVYLDVHPQLRPLLRQQKGLGTVLDNQESTQISTYVHCMDLPRIFGREPVTGPHWPPYLTAPPGVPVPEVLKRHDKMNVGLVWAGSPVHGRDALRSISLNRFEALLNVPGYRFFGLMVGSRAQDISACGFTSQISDLSDHLQDWLRLAAVIAALDLVITVDTAVAHLAGAMGKPVWLLLCTPPDWRWGLQRETTPLYATMQLFRQPRPQDWPSVLTEVERRLRDHLQEGSGQ